MSKLDLTISIVSGSRPDLLQQCFQSLFASLDSSLACEIWLVDNASPGHEGEQIAARFPSVQVVRNDAMKGFAANHNQIMERRQGRYFLLLNDDVILRPGACQRLVAAADSHTEAGFFGPRLLNPDGTLQRSAYKFPSVQLALMEAVAADRLLPAVFDNYSRWAHRDLRSVDFLSGAALMVRSEVIDKIGKLDESFFMYAEETDWCMRGRRHGFATMLVPEAEIVHYGGQSTVGLSAERAVEFLRGQERFVRKHYGEAYLSLYRLLCFVKHAPRLLLSSSARSAKADMERDIVLWSLGLLRRPGLAETLSDKQICGAVAATGSSKAEE